MYFIHQHEINPKLLLRTKKNQTLINKVVINPVSNSYTII